MLTPTELAFMRSASASPADDAPRLVFADHLDECSQILSDDDCSDVSEGVRARVIWSRMIRAGCVSRESRPMGIIYPPLVSLWFDGSVQPSESLIGGKVSRGMVSELEMPWSLWHEWGARMVRRFPLERMEVLGAIPLWLAYECKIGRSFKEYVDVLSVESLAWASSQPDPDVRPPIPARFAEPPLSMADGMCDDSDVDVYLQGSER